MNDPKKTFGGIIAILCWSSTFAVARPLTEDLGIFTATALMFLIGGSIGSVFYFHRASARSAILKLPRNYLVACGTTFVLYCLCLYLSIGLVTTRQQVIEIGLINYLWPSLIILLSVPLFKYKANLLLPVGLILAFSGVVLSAFQGESFSFSATIRNLENDTPAYVLALLGALSWALYSNFSRYWGSKAGSEIVSLFILLTGVFALPLRFVFDETSTFTKDSIWQLLYMGLVPTFLAYVLWDGAMKKGNMVLVASLSFFTPLLATYMSWIFLDLEASWLLWVACGLILGGSYLANKSTVDLEGRSRAT